MLDKCIIRVLQERLGSMLKIFDGRALLTL